MSSAPLSALIAARVPFSIKAAFRTLATRQGLTESDLLNRILVAVLQDNDIAEPIHLSNSKLQSGDRFSVRLRHGDSGRLCDRAAARGMRPGRYLTALIHGHLRADPPLPMAELEALKQAVSELTALRRQLDRSAAKPSSGAPLMPLLFELAAAVESVRHAVRDTVRSNLVSWESADV